MKLELGNKIPDFEVSDQNGKMVKTSDFFGKKVILFFYPKDNTPTCTIEACNFRDYFDDYKKNNYVVYGISVDPAKSHLKFIEKHQLPYDLLVDDKHELVNLFGVWVEKTLYGRKYMGTARTTFVFDENSQLIKIIDKVKSKEHHSQIL